MSITNNIFATAKQYLDKNTTQYNVNVLSAICTLLNSEKNKNILFNELITIHSHTDTNLILSTLSIIKNNKQYTNIYVDAIRQTNS